MPLIIYSMRMLILIYLINKNIDWEDVWLKENIDLIFIQVMSRWKEI